jgi:branched-chain amino acid transport system substrate-binding protein
LINRDRIKTRRHKVKRMRRTGILAMLGVAAALLVVGCAGGAGGGGQGDGGAPTVKMVSDLPLQGASRIDTVSMVNAIKLALQQRDYKAGDIKIEYESMDDATAQAGQWDEAKCAENAQKVAQDEEVVGWVGPFNSGCAAVEIPILNEAHLGMISPANTYIGLTKPSPDPSEPDKYYPTGERNYARVIVADDKQGAAGAKLMEQQGFESVFILDDKETYGKGLADEVQKYAEYLGIEILGREGIDGSASNYRSLMSKIKQTNPDAIYFGGIIENNPAQLVKDKVGAGMSNEDVAFIVPDGVYTDTYISQAGDAAEGSYITFGGLPPEKLPAEGQEFVEQFEKEYGEVHGYTAYAYEAANVMLDAIARAGEDGEVDREEVIQEIFATEDYKGVLGTWSFDQDGDTTLTELSVLRVEGGEFKLDRILDVEDVVER